MITIVSILSLASNDSSVEPAKSVLKSVYESKIKPLCCCGKSNTPDGKHATS
jgi:hypothetical protein